MEETYLNSTRGLFQYYRSLGSKTFAQLTDDQLQWKSDEESNSIAIIVNHMWGNMLSRWTNFLTEDGEKSWRERDMEFESVINTRAELEHKWNEGWQCVFDALDTINESNFDTKVYIRSQEHTIIDAVNRQLGHYAYHTGQIVLIGRMLAGNDWMSLSIPKGQSNAFNQAKTSKGKHEGSFTDDLKFIRFILAFKSHLCIVMQLFFRTAYGLRYFLSLIHVSLKGAHMLCEQHKEVWKKPNCKGSYDHAAIVQHVILLDPRSCNEQVIGVPYR